MSESSHYQFLLNPRVKMRLQHVGEEQEPVLTIDNALQNPESLIEYAGNEVQFEPAWNDNGGYPGIRSPAPLNYAETLVRSLTPIIVEAFSLPPVEPTRARCNLSLVTRKPGELSPLQSIPHIDTTDRLAFAFLHYLGEPGQGGTAFYQHRATGFQTISAEREAIYLGRRDQELALAPPKSEYIIDSNETYKKIGEVEAGFNRLLIYRSQQLHSGLIRPGADLNSDPALGRLTANVFAKYKTL